MASTSGTRTRRSRPILAVPAGLFALLLPATAPGADGALAVYYMERPPYYMTVDQRPAGLLNDIALSILDEAGIPHRFTAMPPKRILAELSRPGAHACSVGWFRTPERGTSARFSLPIYRNRPMLPLARPETAAALHGRGMADILADQGLLLGTPEGFSYGREMDGLIARHSPRIYAFAGSQRQFARMLAAGRIDYMLVSPEEVEELIADAGIAPHAVALVEVPDAPQGATRHLMCAHGVPAETMQRIDAAILRLQPVKDH